MKLLKVDNYQTWLIENEGKGILIDPWLSKQLQPDGSIFIQRRKAEISTLTDDEYKDIKAIIITAPFEDHLHIESIKSFSKDVEIYTSKLIRKMLVKAGVKNSIYILGVEGIKICSMHIKPIKTGFPYHPFTFALLVEDNLGNKIFHEGHIARSSFLKANNIKADTVILTAEEVKLFGFLRLGMDSKRTLEACNLLGAKNLFITGSNPEKTTGLISKFLLTKPLEKTKIESEIKIHHQAGDSIKLS